MRRLHGTPSLMMTSWEEGHLLCEENIRGSCEDVSDIMNDSSKIVN